MAKTLKFDIVLDSRIGMELFKKRYRTIPPGGE
jgi:hypothetical protein